MKTKESRFPVHDELTAPERSLPILKGALSSGGQLSNFLGVLAGAPAVLRAYARFRSELRHGTLPLKSQQRIALGVAEHQGSEYWLVTLQRTARESGLGLDETGGAPPKHLHEEAREAGWTDEQILEAVAHVSLGLFNSLVAQAGDVPKDGSHEEGRLQQAA